ncbi:hypothetical protein [Spirulina subsalsa]|uniref:hypothetical protein n=1 Tax=Spirulina subsalsa TaxID=54311 RepID=UPI00031F74F0|nr:hypothetical protein [Spirulina subsalsa]
MYNTTTPLTVSPPYVLAQRTPIAKQQIPELLSWDDCIEFCLHLIQASGKFYITDQCF